LTKLDNNRATQKYKAVFSQNILLTANQSARKKKHRKKLGYISEILRQTTWNTGFLEILL